ncbi:Imm49 family immunity protein [Streptomyces sp. CA-249302]|uniref:Imm49 family immunity protein n=1 Tax=Streptomyces sp. CA-249302 TaxID=3240058 RepID=UPI003D93D6B8
MHDLRQAPRHPRHARLGQLSDVPISLLRESGAVFDEYVYELMRLVLYPPLGLFHRLLRGDGDRALGPLAMACLAHDSGIPVEVESGYIPKYLVERGRVGDFPT